MSDKFKPEGCEMFEQALKNYDQILQAGMKSQEEEAFKTLLDCAGKMQMPKDWQKRWSSSVIESLPLVQKRIEESLQMIQDNSRTNLELLKQAIEACKVDSAAGAQEKIQGLWETSLQTLRTNAQAVTQLNARAGESWMQFVQKWVEIPAAAAASKTKAA